MSETLKPETADHVLDALKWAAAEKVALDVRGNGSKQGFGRPMQTTHCLDLSGLSGIKVYEPHELFMTAYAGTPVVEIEATLRQNNQQMAFEPADLGPLMGAGDGVGTIGGVIACNLAGPRRIQAGAARDHFLGFNAVSGRGEVFKSGGTVVKNVTGFDLSKLIAGSFGTLAVMTEVTFKVLPAAEKTRTVLALGLTDTQAMKAMAQALGSANDVSGAAHLPASTIERSGVSYVSGAGQAVTAVRLEGPGPSVEHRCRAIRGLWADMGAELEELHSENSARFWKEIRDAGLLDPGKEKQVWRVSVPPMEGAGVGGELVDATGGEVFYDWGGGLIWLAHDICADANHDHVRAAIAKVSKAGGHATLILADAGVRGQVPVFEPQTGALAQITARIKEGFDPEGVLNPGRMVEGV